MKKIVVGISGGIDSATALFLLKKQGWEVTAVHLDIPVWKKEKNIKVKKIADFFDIPFFQLKKKKQFLDKVVSYFIEEYQKGFTPNPCIICNHYFKIKQLLDFAQKKGINKIATGHYVQTKGKDKIELLKGIDEKKDQSYNLCLLNQKQLKSLVFPLGKYTKKQVLKIAGRTGLSSIIKQKPSQDFCYLANSSVKKFLKEKLGTKTGKIVNQKGEVLGRHHGLHFYTIGQRRSLNLNHHGPFFVKGFDLKKNQLIVTKQQKDLFTKQAILKPVHFIDSRRIKNKIKVEAKIRYRHPQAKAILMPEEKNNLKIIFNKPQRAITPGQFAVFYQQKVCLGGGRICKKLPE